MRLLVMALALMLGVAGAAAADGWSRYVNPRFGFALDIPPEFIALQPSDNGDGQAFVHQRVKAEMKAFGSFNTEDETPAQYLTRYAGYHEQAKWTVSYRKSGEDWAALSGTKNGRIFYERLIFTCEGRIASAAYIEYPDAMKATFDPIVERVAKSLTAADGAECGG